MKDLVFNFLYVKITQHPNAPHQPAPHFQRDNFSIFAQTSS